MTIPLASRPRFSDATVRAVLGRLGVAGEVEPLPSERDQNFHVRGADGGEWLLKISNAHDPVGLLEMQDAILRRLADGVTGFEFPAPAAAPAVLEADGSTHTCRLLHWVPGTVLASCRPQPLDLLREVGGLMGRAAAALLDFEHPDSRREIQWDLTRVAEICGSRIVAIADPAGRSRVSRWLERIDPAVKAAGEFRRSVVQNDANDHNILCGPVRETPDGWRRRVAGLVDVGDALENPTVAECAVAMAYAMLGRADPLRAAAAVAAGFHSELPLEEREVDVLVELAVARLCLSVCNSAVQQAEEADNRYLSVSEREAWAALELLEAVSPTLARARIRDACGLEPCAAAPAVRQWLAEHREELAPAVNLETDRVHVFDLGVGSPEMGGGAPGEFATPAVSDRLFGIMRREGAALGLGRYDEARCWYGGDLFAAAGDDGPRRRTVHIGVDLFQPAGAPLFAPLAGTVAAAVWNRGELDYGPTLVLEHEPEPGLRFWTLWGHLDPACLERMQPGDSVEAGQHIADIGDYPENGNWAPHAHLQILCDRLGLEGDFPGVVDPLERSTWRSLCPDPALVLRLPEATSGAPATDAAPVEELLARRRRVLGPSLSVSYRRPLHIVRGWRQHLYASDGQPFLDAVNNVPHVGHSHPRVVAAAAAQNELLNTNTRYLHEKLVEYAERLTDLLPAPLSVCYLVCSGSEANELAVRLARAHTGARGMVAVEAGYHGNTSTLVDLSHYKHAGPGGGGAPDWVRVASLPDVYRGIHREETDPAAVHAADVASQAQALAREVGLAGFLVEPLIGCGGQIVPPDGYLPAAFAAVREAGGVCIADEVQIGLGRVGSHVWAFEQQGAVPDIVTLGKPIGNGFPLAAVVTTPEIAASFANGMEYFNTFGGNPVACAVGLAVLDVLEDEALQENALHTGRRLLDGLRAIAPRHPLIGDVRGVGFYVGVELVRDPHTLEPADVEASYVINRMRERGVLVSTDGPLHNVIKIKPPLCFGADDADRLVEVLDTVLAEDLPAG